MATPVTTPSAAPSEVDLYRGEATEWDGFVQRTAGGTFFHLIGWKDVLAEVFRFRPHYLIARRAGEVVGVLPLCEVRSALRRSCLMSLPFTVQGGVCARDDDARSALDHAAVALGNERHARYLELRDGLNGDGFRVREGVYYWFRRQLFATDEENLAAMRRRQRRMVRIGMKSGLAARVNRGDLDIFYDLYARSVRRLGTPVFPRRYFRLLLERFGDQSTILTVWKDATPVASVLSFFFKDAVLPYYAGSRREWFHYAPNDFMYWELMRYARSRGARVFDFGRSKQGSGAFEFKRHWGFAPEPLRYRVHVSDGQAQNRLARGDNMRLLQRAWRLLPLRLTELLGPFFMRHYGVYHT